MSSKFKRRQKKILPLIRKEMVSDIFSTSSSSIVSHRIVVGVSRVISIKSNRHISVMEGNSSHFSICIPGDNQPGSVFKILKST